MNNKTFWALKKREQGAKAEPRTRRTVRGTNVRPAKLEDLPYRELQATAKELDIPANQSAGDLKAAIEGSSE